MEKKWMGVMVASLLGIGLAPACAWAGAPEASERVVPIDAEPNHHAVLQSPSFRVFDAIFPPQKTSLYHRHDKDSVLVCLDGGDVTSEEPGVKLVPRPPIPSGLIYYRPYATGPLVHRVGNQGATEFRILDIELMKPPGAAIALASPSAGWRPVIDNSRLRVSTFVLAPGQSSGEIRFNGPRLLAFVRAGQLRVASGTEAALLDVARGHLDVREMAATQTFTNVGDSAVELVVVEPR